MAIVNQAYVVIESADPAAWHAFLTGIVGAMAAGAADDGAQLYRVDGRVFRFRIEPGGEERLAASGFLVEAGTLDALAARVAAAGHAVDWASAAEAAARGATRLFRTTDPAGHGLEFAEGEALAATPFASPLGVPRFLTGALGLGHSVFGADDFAASLAFFRDVLGLAPSDLPAFELMGPQGPKTHAAFLYGRGGRHHCVALVEMPPAPNQCVHLMVEVDALDEVGRAYDRAIAAGHAISATLGKHSNDGVVSFYVRTPGGFDLEIGYDGVIVDPAAWQTTAHNTVSVWGHEWAWQKALKEQLAKAAAGL